MNTINKAARISAWILAILGGGGIIHLLANHEVSQNAIGYTAHEGLNGSSTNLWISYLWLLITGSATILSINRRYSRLLRVIALAANIIGICFAVWLFLSASDPGKGQLRLILGMFVLVTTAINIVGILSSTKDYAEAAEKP
ncbi:MAG: hypothetical protein ABSA16_11530 [Thermoguttaceae bacterium]